MQTHGNLTASYLWQPGEFARRVLGERPSPVPPTRDLWPPPQQPPTRDLWPPPQQPLSISTLHVAYLQDEPYTRRAATLPPQPYVPTTIPTEPEYHRPRVCTVGTNTEPPPTVLNRLRGLFKKRDDPPIGHPPPGRLTAVPRETALDSREDDSRARRALSGIKKAISGAKYRITPGTDTVESPKIVYDVPKPGGDRMTTTFGARESRSWCKLPTRDSCEKKLRGVGSWCAEQRPRRAPRRRRQPAAAAAPTLQITQV